MCLYSQQKTPVTTARQVPVWKVVQKSFGLLHAPYRRNLLRESPGKPEEHEIWEPVHTPGLLTRIEGGFIHCFTNYKAAKAHKDYLINAKMLYNCGGGSLEIVKGYIPVGIEVWEDPIHSQIATKYVKFNVSKGQRLAMMIRDFFCK